jgi:hypothetical protein
MSRAEAADRPAPAILRSRCVIDIRAPHDRWHGASKSFGWRASSARSMPRMRACEEFGTVFGPAPQMRRRAAMRLASIDGVRWMNDTHPRREARYLKNRPSRIAISSFWCIH